MNALFRIMSVPIKIARLSLQTIAKSQEQGDEQTHGIDDYVSCSIKIPSEIHCCNCAKSR